MNPMFPILLLAISKAFIPTVLLSLVGQTLITCQTASIESGFAILEIMDAVVSILGNVLFALTFNESGNYDISLTMLGIFSFFGIALLLFVKLILSERVDSAHASTQASASIGEELDFLFLNPNETSSLSYSSILMSS
jgi:vacuolar-type H+-ATPase subunit I/STV1